MAFRHGVKSEDGTINLGRPIRPSPTGIIYLVGSAGKGPVNDPVRIGGSLRDGVLTFGGFAGDGFTIPEALDGIFDQAGATVVVVNVCDPATHKTDKSNEARTFDALGKIKLVKPYVSAVSLGTAVSGLVTVAAGGGNGIATLPTGITSVTSVKSADGATTYATPADYSVAGSVITFAAGKGPGPNAQVLVAYNSGALAAGTDFTVDADSGVVTRLSSGKIIAKATVTASYTYVDPTKVTETDIIGGVNETTGAYEGIKAALAVKGKFGIVPKILIAPRFTHTKASAVTANPVVAELQTIGRRLRAVIFADGPDTTDEAAVQYRGDWGSERVMVCDPWHTIAKPDANHDGRRPPSIDYAGVQARVDSDIGFWASVSNQPIFGITGTTRPVDYSDADEDNRANYLNSQQVSTTIREDGFRTWGNLSTSADPAYQFLCVQRTKDAILDALAAGHLWAVDRGITKNYFEEVLGTGQAFMRWLKSEGGILGGEMWLDATTNTAGTVTAGEAYFDFDFTAVYPAQTVIFRAHMTDKYIEEVINSVTTPVN